MSGFVSGLTAGINNGLRVMQYMDSRAQQERENDLQDKNLARADKERNMIDGANKAAWNAFEANRTSFESANQPKTEERINLTLGAAQQDQARSLAEPGALTLGGQQAPGASFGGAGDASLGNSLSLAAQPAPIKTEQVTTQPTAKYDEREGILAGLKARRDYLMSNGADMKTWMGDWGDESKLRSQMRSERIDDAEKRFAATGDPGEYAKVIYPLIDDGMEFVGTKPIKSLDGQEAWEFTTRDTESGKETSRTMTLPQFDQLRLSVRDPSAMVKYEAEALIKRMEADEKIRAEQGGQLARQGTEYVKSKLQLGEIAAKGKEDRNSIAARGAEDRATDRHKPIKLGDGDALVAPGKGGAYETVAERPRTLGGSPQPSAGNRVLDMRAEAVEAIRKGADPQKVAERFQSQTGEGF